jgi:hypothetical protein
MIVCCLLLFFKIESKKLDFKEKAKPKTDTGVHETSASATVVNEENPVDGQTSEDILESQVNDHANESPQN